MSLSRSLFFWLSAVALLFGRVQSQTPPPPPPATDRLQRAMAPSQDAHRRRSVFRHRQLDPGRLSQKWPNDPAGPGGQLQERRPCHRDADRPHRHRGFAKRQHGAVYSVAPEAVRNALVRRGVPAASITTAWPRAKARSTLVPDRRQRGRAAATAVSIRRRRPGSGGQRTGMSDSRVCAALRSSHLSAIPSLAG